MFSKKTAIAAAALLAAFAAQAQSSVNVYGNLDVGIGRFEEINPATGNFESATKVESGSLRESFIGFRGEEDLGGGLKGFFKLESSIGVDTGAQGAANFWGRTSVVGLTGDFGSVTLGNARSLVFLANDAFNPFRADSAVFSSSTSLFNGFPSLVLGTSGLGLTSSAGGTLFGTNVINSITYTSPNLSGFSAAVQVALSEVSGRDPLVALALNYGAGPLAVNFTYEDQTLLSGATELDTKSWLLNGSYDFGAAKLFGQVGQRDLDVGEKYKFYQLGVSVPVTSSGNILASVGQSKFDTVKAREISIAYEHNLSKRTSAYIGLNNTKLDTGTTDEDGNTFVAGVRHAF